MCWLVNTSGTPRNRTRVFRASTGRLGHFSLGTACPPTADIGEVQPPQTPTDSMSLVPVPACQADSKLTGLAEVIFRGPGGIRTLIYLFAGQAPVQIRLQAHGQQSLGSGGRIRTSYLLLNGELPIPLGFTGSRPDPRNRTSPAFRRQVYRLADIPVSRSGRYHRKDSNPQTRLRRPVADPVRRRWHGTGGRTRTSDARLRRPAL